MSKGVVLSVFASFLFGAMYFYTTLLAPLDGEQVFSWRMLLTLPFLTAFMLHSGDWRHVRGLGRRLRQTPWLAPALVASAALVGVQQWLFMWAPLHGRGLQVSLGYFLLPLTMILAGRLVFRERLSRLQGVAAGCAALGVLNELVRLGSFSWEALLVALGYPLYFILRRKLRTDHLGGLWCDMLLLLPVALYFIGGPGLPLAELARHAQLFVLLPLLGAMCALALIAYVLASRLLSFSLFGLLGYVEPVLLVLVALLLGETIRPGEWLTYIPIWLAVGVLVLEGGLHLLKRQRVRRAA